MTNAVLSIETTQQKVPVGKIIETLVALPDGEIVPVSTTDYQWNHSCFCWALDREELATLVAYNALRIELPDELKNRRMVMYPDEGCEHVSFQVDGEHHDFSLYGMVPVNLIQ